MTELVVRRTNKPAGEGPVAIVTPESAGWSYVGFEVYELRRGDRIRQSTGARELCAVMLAGPADFTVGSHAWKEAGSRSSEFEGTPDAVYSTAGTAVQTTAPS